MADYTYQELMKMQNDAIRRVEDMQKKARQTAGLDNTETKKKIPVEEPKHIPMPQNYLKTEKNSAPQPAQQGSNSNSNIKNLLMDINIESDTALLLSLLLLLAEENADESLIMALLYILCK